MDELDSHAIATLRCPVCREAPRIDGAGLTCSAGHRWAWREGYIDCSVDGIPAEAERTLESFGYEWAAFPSIQPEDEAFWQRYSADLDLDRFADSVAVDVGCGKGRFSWFLAPAVGSLVTFDGSASVAVAARNLATRDNVLVLRADLHHAPLADAAFDLVCCIGVLHYVPDPEAGFRAVARLVAPGGTLLLSVYSRAEQRGLRNIGLRAATSLRRITARLPRRLLRVLSAPIAVALYIGLVLPGQAAQAAHLSAVARALPLQTYRGHPLRSLWLDTHNRLSAPFEHRFGETDVRGWLDGAGFVIRSIREDAGWMVVAERPSARP
jgi:SAM-dependent methyltransferase